MPNTNLIDALPKDIKELIFSWINPIQTGKLAQVSKFWCSTHQSNVLAFAYFQQYFRELIPTIKKEYATNTPVQWRHELIKVCQYHAQHFTSDEWVDYMELRSFDLTRVKAVLAKEENEEGKGLQRVFMTDKSGLCYFDLLNTTEEPTRQAILDELFNSLLAPLCKTNNGRWSFKTSCSEASLTELKIPPSAKMYFENYSASTSAIVLFAALCNQIELINSWKPTANNPEKKLSQQELRLILLVSLKLNHELMCRSLLSSEITLSAKEWTSTIKGILIKIGRLNLSPSFSDYIFQLIRTCFKNEYDGFYQEISEVGKNELIEFLGDSARDEAKAVCVEKTTTILCRIKLFYFAAVLQHQPYLQSIQNSENFQPFLLHNRWTIYHLFDASFGHTGDILNACLARGCSFSMNAPGPVNDEGRPHRSHPLFALVKANDQKTWQRLYQEGRLNAELVGYSLKVAAFFQKDDLFKSIYLQSPESVDIELIKIVLVRSKKAILDLLLNNNPVNQYLTAQALTECFPKRPDVLKSLLFHKVDLHQEDNNGNTYFKSLIDYINNKNKAFLGYDDELRALLAGHTVDIQPSLGT